MPVISTRLIWAIIFVVVALVKGFAKAGRSQLRTTQMMRTKRPRWLSPGRRVRSRSLAHNRSHVCAHGPFVASCSALPASPQCKGLRAPMGPSPLIAAPAGSARTIDADQIRRFIAQLSGQSAPRATGICYPAPDPEPLHFLHLQSRNLSQKCRTQRKRLQRHPCPHNPRAPHSGRKRCAIARISGTSLSPAEIIGPAERRVGVNQSSAA